MKLTPENAKAVIPLLQAVADGKTLQMRSDEQEWQDMDEKDVEYTIYSFVEYRIKPEPRVIWANFYENNGPYAHPSEEAARDYAGSNATRIAVRFVEDVTNGK